MQQSDQTAKAAATASEEILLAGPSAVPLVTGLGLSAIVLGAILTPLLSVIGAVIVVLCVARWIGDTRRGIAALPEHHQE
jgi:hypothetical protein